MNDDVSNSRIAVHAARTVFRAYESFTTRFTVLTERAKSRFENQDVEGMRADSRQRLALYKGVVDRVEEKLRGILESRIENEKTWASTKAVFSAYSSEREDWDIAETFFNSMTRRIFSTRGVNEDIEFVATDFASPPNRSSGLVYSKFENSNDIENTLSRILNASNFSKSILNLAEGCQLVGKRIGDRLTDRGLDTIHSIDMIKNVFYRDGRAYLIGRMHAGETLLPIVLILTSSEQGIRVEAALLDEDDLSMLFSFTRSYFHVLTNCPYELVRFLQTILPAKRIAELYISIGFNKHGKTELYREVLSQLDATSHQFALAPGDRGMVMRVFTMPEYDLVFKVIKDRFDPPKTTTHEIVREKYQHVFRHSRVGRLVDAQEFEHIMLPVSRFDKELLIELLDVAGERVTVENDFVHIHHVYLQRRVHPLNLLARSDIPIDRLQKIVLDFGNAIKDLAQSNIFPGDLFLKNFGVTRHDRVVFYDYDELAEVTECNFRKMPKATSYEEEMQAEPWFSVAEDDVFPEEFLQFLGLPEKVKAAFLEQHINLFSTEFWTEAQERIRSGRWLDIRPFQPKNILKTIQPS